MKNKYQRMTKDEKKKVIESYKKSEGGKAMLARLNRLVVIGIFGIVFAIILVLIAISQKESIWNYIYAVILFIASIVFLIGSFRIKSRELNLEALKQKQ